jgi:hypothetical protein
MFWFVTEGLPPRDPVEMIRVLFRVSFWDDHPLLVAFTEEPLAARFVEKQEDGGSGLSTFRCRTARDFEGFPERLIAAGEYQLGIGPEGERVRRSNLGDVLSNFRRREKKK